MPVENAPNIWSFLIVACQVAGTAFAGWLAYRLAIKPKLQEIHTLVNGNLDVERRKNSALRAQLDRHGITPEN